MKKSEKSAGKKDSKKKTGSGRTAAGSCVAEACSSCPDIQQRESYTPSPKEVENGRRVLAILEKIEDVGYIVHRPDLFTVEEPELGLEITIDAEESVICLVAEICTTEHLDAKVEDWPRLLLRLNNMLLHGAFTLHENKVLLRENLAAENLDPNELEDAISAMFAGIIRHAHLLKLL